MIPYEKFITTWMEPSSDQISCNRAHRGWGGGGRRCLRRRGRRAGAPQRASPRIADAALRGDGRRDAVLHAEPLHEILSLEFLRLHRWWRLRGPRKSEMFALVSLSNFYFELSRQFLNFLIMSRTYSWLGTLTPNIYRKFLEISHGQECKWAF